MSVHQHPGSLAGPTHGEADVSLTEQLDALAQQYGNRFADDLAQACETLDQKGGLHPIDRKRVKTGTGY